MIPTVSNNKFIYKPATTIQHDQGLNVYWQGKWQNIPDGDVSIVQPATKVIQTGTNPITIEVTSPFQSTDWYLYNMHLNNFSKIERIASSGKRLLGIILQQHICNRFTIKYTIFRICSIFSRR